MYDLSKQFSNICTDIRVLQRRQNLYGFGNNYYRILR